MTINTWPDKLYLNLHPTAWGAYLTTIVPAPGTIEYIRADIAEMRIAELEQKLQWEQYREGQQGTHWDGCHTAGPEHFECLLRKFKEAEALQIRIAEVAIEMCADKVDEYAALKSHEWESGEVNIGTIYFAVANIKPQDIIAKAMQSHALQEMVDINQATGQYDPPFDNPMVKK